MFVHILTIYSIDFLCMQMDGRDSWLMIDYQDDFELIQQ